MESALTAMTAGAWLFAMVQQVRRLAGAAQGQVLVHLAGWAGVLCYGVLVWMAVDVGDLRVGTVLALTAAIVVTITLLGAMRLPLSHLFVVVFPAGAICVVLGSTLPSTLEPREIPWGLVVHVLLSALAYATLTLAACQALILAWQDRVLRHRRSLRALQGLPPLTHMEELLFQFVWLGLALLSAAIASGFLFLSNLFGQQVVHHTVLSMSSWVVFALLLWGRHALGWRGPTAIRWTLGGFALLVLGYFGSKLMLEIILPAVSG